jgi:hypothetical protein
MAAAIIAITPSALEKKLSPFRLKLYRAFASRQYMGVLCLPLWQALNLPSQHHPFSRAFCSFCMMDPIEPRPQNNHDGHPKRRRRNAPSPGDTPAINRIVPSFNHSPVAASSLNQSPENRPTSDPSHADDEDSFTDRPFTQDPSLLLPPPSPTAVLAAVKAAATVVGLTYVPAPNELTPLEDIPPQEIDIIKRAISDFYHIDEPRDFQIQAIHYLPFHDN